MTRPERFAVTAEIVFAITSSRVLDEVLANVARRTAEALDVWECDIYDYRPAENCTVGLALWSREPHPADADWVGSTQDLADQPIFRRVLQRRPHDGQSHRRSRAAGRGPGRHGVVGREELPARAAGVRRRGDRLPGAGREAPPASLQRAGMRAGFDPRRAGRGRHRERPPAQRPRAAGHDRRSHRSLQPALLQRAPRPGGGPCPSVRLAAVASDDRRRRLQALQRPFRPSRRRRAAARPGSPARQAHAGSRSTLPRATAATSSPSSCPAPVRPRRPRPASACET